MSTSVISRTTYRVGYYPSTISLVLRIIHAEGIKGTKATLQRTCDCLCKMSFPKETNMKTTTNYAEKEGQLSLSVAIISQVKLLILFTVDLSKALNHRFCLL